MLEGRSSARCNAKGKMGVVVFKIKLEESLCTSGVCVSLGVKASRKREMIRYRNDDSMIE